MKENKIEKFILNLSNRWECTPQEAVDRLNSMNESEINKLIKSMVKKFQGGGQTGNNEVQVFDHRFPNDDFYIINDFGNGETDEYLRTGSGRDQKRVKRLINRKPNYSKIPFLSPLDSVITIRKPNGGGELRITSPHSSKSVVSPELWKSLNDQMDARKAEALSFKNGGMIDCLRAGGNLTECKKCGGKAAIKAQEGKKLTYDRPNWWESTFGVFSDSTKHPRQDGKGHYTAEILPSGDTLTTIVGPYTTFTERRMEDGSGRFFDVMHKDYSKRYYDPERKDEGWFRERVPNDVKEMFNDVRDRFETPTDSYHRIMNALKTVVDPNTYLKLLKK